MQFVATVAYVGSQGRNLFLRSVANQILRGQAVIPSTATSLPAGAGVVNILNAAGTQVTAVRTVREFSIPNGNNVLNPFAEVDFKTSGGSDSYNALQTQLSRRLSIGADDERAVHVRQISRHDGRLKRSAHRGQQRAYDS